MKKATLYLLMISLIGMLEVPVHAADVYADESTELYSFDEGAMCDDDFATECQADVSDKKLQQDFESAMKDGIGLGLDDFLETSYSGNSTGSTQSDSEAEVLEADFEAAMQDENIKLSEDGIETMNLISTDDYNIDTEYAVEVNDYKSKPNKDVFHLSIYHSLPEKKVQGTASYNSHNRYMGNLFYDTQTSHLTWKKYHQSLSTNYI